MANRGCTALVVVASIFKFRRTVFKPTRKVLNWIHLNTLVCLQVRDSFRAPGNGCKKRVTQNARLFKISV